MRVEIDFPGGLIATLVAVQPEALVHHPYMECQVTGVRTLIITLVTVVFDTFVLALYMLFQLTSLLCLIVTLSAIITYSIM